MKLRPVFLLTGPLGSIPEILVAHISSVTPAQLLPSDLLVDPNKPEYRLTQLKTPSVLRLHKLATIHCSSLARSLGELDTPSMATVTDKLTQLLALQRRFNFKIACFNFKTLVEAGGVELL